MAKITHLFAGLATTVFTLVVVGFTFALLLHFEPFITPHLDVIELFTTAVLIAGVVFAAQFNHSRIALVCLWFLVLSIYDPQQWTVLGEYGHMPLGYSLLTSCGILAFISLTKDRGLISVHGIFRVIVIVALMIGGFYWLSRFDWLMAQLSLPTLEPFKPLFKLNVWLVIAALILLWQSLRLRCLTRAALVAIAIVTYVLETHKFIEPKLVMAYIALHSVLVVIINSYVLAYRDDLTGLPSRRALNQLALSLGRKYTVAMMDIDHFKKFNDTYGHDIGDEVLKLVASKLAKVKGGGKVFRYGGEEFTVVFPRKKAAQTLDHLESLRQSIADYAMVVRQPERKNNSKKSRGNGKPDNEKTVSVTISIGVAQRQSKQSFEQTLKEADLALYRAKKKGRNNVSE